MSRDEVIYMTFMDITRCVAIGIVTLNALGTSWQITKLNKENPSYNLYKEILFQRATISLLAIPLFFERISIYLAW